MKLRLKDNSLRLRVSQSELARLIDAGHIESSIYFAQDETSKFTYALELDPAAERTALRYAPHNVTVVVATAEAVLWGKTEQVGIYATVDIGPRGSVDILVEKDYACLDLSDAENADTFPNPNTCAPA
jgi:hypothetical protein